ncbi:MAG: phytanoyl-CoA dioxygenase family protein [Gemmatimonadetes bacterium]|nr:phytanoyl-CoA dioxygenase family protein [Gemmatimonadota bacterium]
MNLQSHLDELAGQGYTTVRGALSPGEVEATRRAVIELLDAEEEVARTTGTQTDNLRNAHAIVGKHPHFHEFYLNPPVMRIVRALLGEGAMLYDGNIRVPMPTGRRDAAKGFQVHVDREDYTVLPFAGGTHFPMALNVVWCLVDFTPENGTTRLWPGSHLSCEVPDPDHDAGETVRIEAAAGSAIVWDAALWHQGGINRSDRPRWSVIAYYLRPWLKGKTDSLRLLPPEAVATMSDEAKRLVGIMAAPPDYSEVKALDSRQLAALTLEQRKVLGFPVY